MDLTPLEQQFRLVYGDTVFRQISEFIHKNNIVDFYVKARQTPQALFDFGFHYGIVEIVAFCYCVLKCPIDINTTVSGYYKSIGSSPEMIAELNGKLSPVTVPVTTSGGQSGIVFGTLDKFTPLRINCIKFMLAMKKFSRYKIVRGKFIYEIVDKYVEPYRLLKVY